MSNWQADPQRSECINPILINAISDPIQISLRMDIKLPFAVIVRSSTLVNVAMLTESFAAIFAHIGCKACQIEEVDLRDLREHSRLLHFRSTRLHGYSEEIIWEEMRSKDGESRSRT